ncbi:acyltransferase [Sphingomonas sp. HITSZ_GF]|uniref:acyltransferase family protein n=1 Tax=Sphingomonas sp. HITSZ_GF TaxID=3037247 RepID=UPI00240E324C|nr:acyltransferase [Sphingomonas sp. HITSZ_GF]MDG2534904.1 acyltransferase [Sphingomonas sp. HITSZ_GF]
MPEAPDADERAAFVYMDAIRFVAAAAVAISHIRNLALVDYEAVQSPGVLLRAFYFLTGFGHQSVMVFFVLSGFWIAGSAVRRVDEPKFWTSYMIDRYSRLAIVLVPALALGAICDLSGLYLLHAPIYSGASQSLTVPRDLAENLTPRVALANLVFLQAVAAPVFGSNSPLWSLAYEFWYYIWFPALWLLFARRRASIMLVTLVVGLAAPAMLLRFVPWLCGAGLFFAYRWACTTRKIGRRALGWTVLLLGGAGLAVALVLSRVATDIPDVEIPIALTFAVTLFGLCLVVPPRLGLVRALGFYGAHASYSFYVIHFPLALLLAAALTPPARLTPDAHGLAVVALIFAATLAAAWLFSRVTERHTAILRHQLRLALLGPAESVKIKG